MGARATVTLLAGAALLIALPATGAEAKKRDYRVKVTRTAAGIPHVVARDFGSLGYGQGFTYAQDNACLFLDTVATVRGDRSRFFGADGLARNYSNGATDPNFKSDSFWKWIEASGARANVGKAFNKQAKQLYRGWVAGFNTYLSSGQLRDPACRGRAWVRKVTVRDMVLRGVQVLINAGAGNLISGIYDAQPPATATSTSGAATARSAPDPDIPALREQIDDLAGESDLGSNGLALGRDATQRGTGMLLSNPHFPWRGIDRFWMAHLTVKGKRGYDAMGGTLGGFPLIGIGFNRSMSWTHTVSTGRRFVVRQLRLDPADPTSYIVDGQSVPMTRTVVDVNGQQRTVYGTRYGPIVNIAAASYSWTNTTAYALTDSNLVNGSVVNQYIAMGRARSVGRLLRVEERRRGIPFFNTIAADRKGTALYADVGRYSNVPTSLIEACLPPGLATITFQQARLITLDGTRSDCTPAGSLPASEMPRIARRDYVLNSNDSYWLANPQAPITGITPLIGLERTAQGTRTRSGNLMVREVLGSGGRFTLGALQSLFQNDRNHLAELVSDPLADLCTSNPSVTIADGRTVDISEACPILRSFDNTGNLDSPGAWLFAAYQRRAPGGLSFWSDSFDPANPLTTPNQLNVANPDQLRALGAAVQELRDNGVALGSGMRGVQVATRGSRRISIHGCGNCFQNINSSNGSASANAPYGEVIQGSSMVLATELRKRSPIARGILTFSQATDPTSPWFANMTRLFSEKKWVKLPFTPEQVRKAKRTRVKLPGV